MLCPKCGTWMTKAVKWLTDDMVWRCFRCGYESKTIWPWPQHELYGLVISLACWLIFWQVHSTLWMKILWGLSWLGLALFAEGFLIELGKRLGWWDGPGPVHKAYWWFCELQIRVWSYMRRL